jgi:hypothetical protein
VWLCRGPRRERFNHDGFDQWAAACSRFNRLGIEFSAVSMSAFSFLPTLFQRLNSHDVSTLIAVPDHYR